jgi:diguanylate cyclase (GGDEF)-like protein
MEAWMKKSESSPIDELTQCLSRKGFLQNFHELLAKAKAGTQETPISLALLDVDNFKIINDQNGHVTGDNVLVMVAKVIQAQVEKDERVGRYGGDEFVIVFPDKEREQAFLTVEQIRQQLSQAEVISTDGESILGISISGGVASFPMDGRTENELFRKADHALYHAKASGRKQIRLAYEERMVPKTSHYTQTQLERLSKLAEERGVNEADLLREAMDDFLTKYGVNDIET